MDMYTKMYEKYTCKCCGTKDMDWSDMSFDIEEVIVSLKPWLARYVGSCTICKVCYGRLELEHNNKGILKIEKKQMQSRVPTSYR